MRERHTAHALALVLAIAGLVVVRPGVVRAQESDLKIGIVRPADGETLYGSPDGPFAHVPVAGWVAAEAVDLKQLAVRLEVFQGTKLFGSATTTPSGDGTYSFDVALNSNVQISHPVTDCGGYCHTFAPLGFPSGPVLLRVTVTDPRGRTATAERSITVDQSGYADVPVQVMVADDPKQTLAGVSIVATTRLYAWRAREFSVKTDAQGRALLHIEALAQAPTRYLFSIEPIVFDGVLYSSREALQVTLPPGATSVAPIVLMVDSRRGQITGTVSGDRVAQSMTVRAIELPRGAAYTTKTTQSNFTLSDLPIGKYLLTIDEANAAPQTIDLSATPVASATLKLSTALARIARGVVRDTSGSPIPFAWIATEDRNKVGRVSPSSGEFALFGLPAETHVLWVTAPGYWSRPVALADELDVTLTSQPNTRTIPWGSGTLTVPPQTIADLSGNQLALKRGWVWGKGDGAFAISTPDLDIALQGGLFTLEYLPGETNWFYLREGKAQVSATDSEETIALSAGQMVAFGKGVIHPSAVTLDDAVVRAVHAGETSPVAIETDQERAARLRDAVEQLGIPFAWATVFAVLLAAGLAVLGMWLIWRRQLCSR